MKNISPTNDNSTVQPLRFNAIKSGVLKERKCTYDGLYTYYLLQCLVLLRFGMFYLSAQPNSMSFEVFRTTRKMLNKRHQMSFKGHNSTLCLMLYDFSYNNHQIMYVNGCCVRVNFKTYFKQIICV